MKAIKLNKIKMCEPKGFWLVMNKDGSAFVNLNNIKPIIDASNGYWRSDYGQFKRSGRMDNYCKNWKTSLRKIVDNPKKSKLIKQQTKKIENQRKELNRLNEDNTRLKHIIKGIKVGRSHLIKENQELKKTVPPLKNEIKELKSANKKWSEDSKNKAFKAFGLENDNKAQEKRIENQSETIEALTRENTRLEQLVDVNTAPQYAELVELEMECRTESLEKRIEQLEKERDELTQENKLLHTNHKALVDVIEAAGYNDQNKEIADLKQDIKISRKITSELIEANEILKKFKKTVVGDVHALLDSVTKVCK